MTFDDGQCKKWVVGRGGGRERAVRTEEEEERGV